MPKDERGSESRKIVVTLRQVEHLAAGFARTWQRPPSAEEPAGLVRDHAREEVLYREALALGPDQDQDDTVIRRRLRRKLEFILDDVAARAEPSKAELQAYVWRIRKRFEAKPD